MELISLEIILSNSITDRKVQLNVMKWLIAFITDQSLRLFTPDLTAFFFLTSFRGSGGIFVQNAADSGAYPDPT